MGSPAQHACAEPRNRDDRRAPHRDELISSPRRGITLRAVASISSSSPLVRCEPISTPLFDRLAVAVLVAVAGVALMTFRDYGLGWDDYTHFEYGELLVGLHGSRFCQC